MYEECSKQSRRSLQKNDRGLFPTLVLAEEADDMWLTVVSFREPPRVGATFRFQNREWVVVWREDVGCVAAPARQSGSSSR